MLVLPWKVTKITDDRVRCWTGRQGVMMEANPTISGTKIPVQNEQEGDEKDKDEEGHCGTMDLPAQRWRK